MTKVGFIGLGNMGAPMALNLVKAGYSVSVFDRERERVSHLVTNGARAVEGVAALIPTVDVVITSLPGPREVKGVVEGANGLIAALRPGNVWIDMTTNDPALVRALEKEVVEKGAAMLDAPVTGAVDGARRGTLVIFAGGNKSTFEAQLAVLKAMGSTVIHCGGIGTGNVVKLVTNQLWFINAAAIGEALVLGVRGGVEALTLWSAIKSSVGNSFVVEHDVPSIFAGHYDPSFSLDLCVKDLHLISSLGTATAVPLELTKKAQEIFEKARVTYGGKSGELHVAKLIEDATGTSLRVDGHWVAPWEA